MVAYHLKFGSLFSILYDPKQRNRPIKPLREFKNIKSDLLSHFLLDDCVRKNHLSLPIFVLVNTSEGASSLDSAYYSKGLASFTQLLQS